MTRMPLLIDHGLANNSSILNETVDDGFWNGHCLGGCLARPILAPRPRLGAEQTSRLPAVPCRASNAGHFGPAIPSPSDAAALRLVRHEVALPQPILRQHIHRGTRRRTPRKPVDDRRAAHDGGNPLDDASGEIVPEARQHVSHTLRMARRLASMWPGTPPLVAEYIQSVGPWDDHQISNSSGGSSNNTNNPPLLPAPLLILPP